MAEAGLVQSSSAPTLPPLSCASPPSQPSPAAAAAQARANRAAGEAAKRTNFLSGLINEDLQKLASWHGVRPAHEQKRFLRSVDALYKAYDSASGGGEQKPKAARPTEAERIAAIQAAQEAAMASAAAMQRAAEEDPLAGPPRSPRALAPSASEPSMIPAQPIEVFEQKKRQGMRKQRDPTAEDPNSLMEWLEGQSLTSQTTATTAMSRRTRFSDVTMTSLGGSSICSEPGTMHQMQFRAHKRAYAANKNNWKAINQHEAGFLKDGVPNISWPDSERLQTSFKDQFGSRPKGEHITKKMYEHILKGDQHEFVSRFLEAAPPEQREQFTGMVRSLQCLRRMKDRENTSTTNLDFDLEENARLWRPPKQQPVFDTSEVNLSRVPLGSMQQTTKKAKPPASPPLHCMPMPPPSPSVSGLGSLPLTRLSTPLVISEVGH